MKLNENLTDIFFDLDHTLWDFDKNSELAFDIIFKKNYSNINVSNFIKHYIPINQSCWKLYQNDKITHTALRYLRLKNSFEAINFTISDDEIEQIALDYLEYLPQNNHLLEGTINILNYLKPKYNLHIITNGFAEVQDKKLINANIKHYFKTITNSEMAGVKKPNPIIFEYAIQSANAIKANSLMIGDCIDADVLGAINSGLDAILFCPLSIESVTSIKQINHLLDLKKYL